MPQASLIFPQIIVISEKNKFFPLKQFYQTRRQTFL